MVQAELRRSGFEQGFQVAAVKVPTDRPSEHWIYLPALALVGFVWLMQGRRERALVGNGARAPSP